MCRSSAGGSSGHTATTRVTTAWRGGQSKRTTSGIGPCGKAARCGECSCLVRSLGNLKATIPHGSATWISDSGVMSTDEVKVRLVADHGNKTAFHVYGSSKLAYRKLAKSDSDLLAFAVYREFWGEGFSLYICLCQTSRNLAWEQPPKGATKF